MLKALRFINYLLISSFSQSMLAARIRFFSAATTSIFLHSNARFIPDLREIK